MITLSFIFEEKFLDRGMTTPPRTACLGPDEMLHLGTSVDFTIADIG